MLNKVQLIGNVGNTEVRATQNGDNVGHISLATSEKWKDKNGQQQERTEWHRIVVFGGLANVVRDYVQKGTKLYVEGKLQTRKWTDNTGQDKYTTEILVDIKGTLLMLGGRPQENSQETSAHPVQVDDGPEFNDEIPF